MYKGVEGDDFDIIDIPKEHLERAGKYRHKLLEAVADIDESLMDKYVQDENSVTLDEIKRALRQGVLKLKITPVLCGSSLRNKGIELLMDAICDYLPSPLDVPAIEGIDLRDESIKKCKADKGEPFVALAFSMFGFYELKLPDSLVSKVSSASHGSGYVGIAIMGFLSALIVGPCVAAPLAGALVYIGQTGDAILGGMALFFMSIGMGIPLIVVGVSAGKFMPKPGAWMTMVTAIFGVMMLGVAIWMLEKVVDPSVTMLLYGFLGIGFSLYLGAFDKEGHIFKRSVAIIMFIYSIALFIGFLGGSSSMLKPLGFLKPQIVNSSSKTQTKELDFKVVKSIAELDIVLEKNRGKKILLDFAAEWCVACKELDEITFSNKNIKAKLGEFVLIRADVTENSEEEKELSKKYGVFGPPAIIFFDEELNVRKSKTVIGFVDPDNFLLHLEKL